MVSTRLVLTLAGFLFSMLPGGATAQDAGSILARHQAFAKWSASDSGMTSWHLSGTRRNGAAVDSFDEYRHGLVFRDALATKQGVSDETGFTGRYVWHADANGYWNVVLGRAAQTAIDWLLVRSEALNGLPSQLAGNADVAGHRCDIVRVQPAGVVPMDLYEDAQTGAFLKVVVAPGAPDSTTFDDIAYTTTSSGRQILSSWTVAGSRYVISNASVQTIANSDLLPSPSAPNWTYSSSPVSITQTAVNYNERVVRVHVSVNGHVGTFVLGTDAPSIILFDPFAAQAGVENLGTSDFSPYLGNKQYEGYARARELKVGDATLHNVVVQRINAPNSKLDGVLGYDFFAGAIVDVNLQASQLKIEDPVTTTVTPASSDYAFPIDLTDHTPVISMTLPSGAVAHPAFASDLSGFMLLSQALRDSGKINGDPVSNDRNAAIGGYGASGAPIEVTLANFGFVAWNGVASTGRCISVPQMSVGPYTYENPPVCMGSASIFGNNGGQIGMDFLRHFNWVVDYPHQRFVLSPSGD
jgi:hypothetical protein